MKLVELKKILHKKCGHHEEWHCGPAKIIVHGRNANPRFDCVMDLYFETLPSSIDIKKISRLLKLLDTIGNQRYTMSL
jgi:hypothetical protein